MLIVDLIAKLDLGTEVFYLDTGRLHDETYELIDRAKEYGKIFKPFFPDAADVEAYVREQGINGFYGSVDARKSCCHVEKVLPLERAHWTVKKLGLPVYDGPSLPSGLACKLSNGITRKE